jgi:amino acid transporter
MCGIVFLFLLLGLRLLLNQSSTETIDWIKPIHNPLNYDFMSIVSGAALASFSFLGFDAITTLSEESIRPAKDVGRAAVLSCLAGGILFMLQVYVAQMVWPDYSIFKSTETAFFEIVNFVGGNYFSVLFTIAIIVSALSAGLTGQSSAARIMYAMGRDKVLPAKFFSYIHPKFETPALNIIMMSVLGVTGALILPLDLVAELMNFGALLGFMFVNLSVILYFYFQKKDKKILSHFVVPAFGFVSCTNLWINLSTRTLWIGLVWLAIGCIYYLIKQKKFTSRQAGLRFQ